MKQVFAAAFIFTALSLNAQSLDSIQVKSQDVQGQIKMITGWGGNIGALPGPDGVILIDDQMSELSEKLKAEVGRISEYPIRFIINTHYHYDHTDGNKALGKEGNIIISHENVRERLTTDQVIEYFNHEQKAYPTEGLPKVTFLDSLTLHFNGETLKIYHFDNAHTDGDAVIHFINSNVVHMGDIFVTYGFPFVDIPAGGNVPGIINTIDKILEKTNENTLFIPGHGTVSNRSKIIEYNNMLRTLAERVRGEIEKGKLLSEIDINSMIKGYEGTGGRPAEDFIMFVYLSLSGN